MSDATYAPERYQFDKLVVLKHRTASAEIAEEIYQRAFNYPTHGHEQAYFLLTGQRVYKERIGRRTFYHPPNAILWRPPEISHSDAIERTNGRSFSVFLKDRLLGKFSDYSSIPAEFSESNTMLVFLANRLRNEFRNWGEGSELIAEGLVLEMLGYAARKKVPVEKSPPGWIVRIVEKLEDEFLESHTNQELADEVGVHPVHLARTFRRYYGKSVGTYLKEKRVHRAALLIMQDDLCLAEIAYSSGFSDQSQFTRAFKEIMGITPGAFRLGS
jgi:AraC family transcriptional regulator